MSFRDVIERILPVKKITCRNIFFFLVFIILLTVFYALPVSAVEHAKIRLPDGLYMYDSLIQQLKNGDTWVGFGKYFIVKNNTIYSSRAAIKKYGVKKANELFTRNKKYKILLGGEKIGIIHDVKIENLEDWDYKEDLLIKNIKEGPAYKEDKINIDVLGSAAKFMAVPESIKK